MTGLYIHIPFCRKKCGYCDFYSIAFDDTLLDRYISAMALEMKSCGHKELSSVYIGGGTPSLLSPPQFHRLFACINSIFNVASGAEISVEANPESINNDTLTALKECGVNRLSIGAQSFDDTELKYLGRIHNSMHLHNAFYGARECGFNNVSIDLIYGLSYQSQEKWQKNISEAVLLKPEHLSLYPLSVEPHTPFYSQNVLTDDDAQALMYEYSVDFLAAHGYEHYEISNWSLPGYRCSHNLRYWNSESYIGIGASAVSCAYSRRTKNVSDVSRYIELVEAGENAIFETDVLDERKTTLEDIILKLRLCEGIPSNAAALKGYEPALNRLTADKLIEKSGNNYRLTTRGILLSNQVFMEFM